MNQYTFEDIENRNPAALENFSNPLRKQVRFDTLSKSDINDSHVHIPKPPPTRPLGNIENIYNASNEYPNSLFGDVVRHDNFTRSFDKSGPLQPNKALELSVFDSPHTALPAPTKTAFRNYENNAFGITSVANDANKSISPIYNPTTTILKPVQTNQFQKSEFKDSIFSQKYSKQYASAGRNSPNNNSFFTMPNSKTTILDTPPQKSSNEHEKNIHVLGRRTPTNYFPEAPIIKSNYSSRNIQNENIMVESIEKCVCNCRINERSNRIQTSPQQLPQNIFISNKRKSGADEKRNIIISQEQSKKAIPKHDDNISSDMTTSNGQLPTVFDLYTLIKMQIEQLHYLQERVNDLSNKVENKYSNDHPIHSSIKYSENEQFTVHQKINSVQEHSEPKNIEMQKISVGVMTSFEMTVSKVKINNNNIDEGVQTSVNVFENKNSNIQTNNSEKVDHYSNGAQVFNFLDGINHCNYNADNTTDHFKSGIPICSSKIDEALPLRQNNERIRTEIPLPTFTNTKDSYNSDNYSQPQMGWTFYNNTMKHINDILITPPDKFQDEIRNRHRKKITVAEVNHLNFDITDVNASSSKRVTFNINKESPEIRNNVCHYKPVSETSLHVDKLATKYFGNHFSYQNNTKKTLTSPSMSTAVHTNEIENDLSISKIQHMEKFNLLPGLRNVEKINLCTRTNGLKSNKEFRQFLDYREPLPNKILDITTLKQQPKLL